MQYKDSNTRGSFFKQLLTGTFRSPKSNGSISLIITLNPFYQSNVSATQLEKVPTDARPGTKLLYPHSSLSLE